MLVPPLSEGPDIALLMSDEHAVADVSACSSEKYPVPPFAAIGATKLTVPVFRLALMVLKYAFGPPYPVLSNPFPGMPKATMPSPSKAKMPAEEASSRLWIGWLLLLMTPIS
jgi:hypothetical protein